MGTARAISIIITYACCVIYNYGFSAGFVSQIIPHASLESQINYSPNLRRATLSAFLTFSDKNC